MMDIAYSNMIWAFFIAVLLVSATSIFLVELFVFLYFKRKSQHKNTMFYKLGIVLMIALNVIFTVFITVLFSPERNGGSFGFVFLIIFLNSIIALLSLISVTIYLLIIKKVSTKVGIGLVITFLLLTCTAFASFVLSPFILIDDTGLANPPQICNACIIDPESDTCDEYTRTGNYSASCDCNTVEECR